MPSADIVLVNPKFETSYWGFERALPIFGKRAAMPVAGLPLLAALTPPPHRVTIVDENVAPLDFDRLARADIVGVTGMSVQRARMRTILTELKRRGAFTVVGGPWVSVHESYFGDLVRTRFVGEAEDTWPEFLRDWASGQVRCRYEQAERTDMTRVPVPRYDLIDMRKYLFGSIQFSRGCPFRCEFCDIIVTFGRRPRLKTPAQILRELEALRSLGTEIVFIVDDNLIGNKHAIRPLLEAVVQFQEDHGFPFIFTTEASLDLAEDEGLMRLMLDANILSVFIGIESPNEASIVETLKHQNVKAGRTITDRVRAVQRAGLDVWSGMILGFDHDDETIFAAHREFLHDASIAMAMIGMLVAIPKTPLHTRLCAAGRLDPDDDSPFGTNVIPARIERQALKDGYARLLRDVYETDAYFERLAASLSYISRPFAPARARYWKNHPAARLRGQSLNLLRAIGLYARLMQRVEDPRLRARYRQEIYRQCRTNRDPGYVLGYIIRCALHYHHKTLAGEMAGDTRSVVNSF